MAEEVTSHECSVCSCTYTDDEGGVQGEFGILPVSFCPTCFSCMCDMAQQFNDPDAYDEDEIKPEHAELMRHLRGIKRIVINDGTGDFHLSFKAQVMYLERAGIAYRLVDQLSREEQSRLGSKIIVEDGTEWNDWYIERDDPALVAVVRELGIDAGKTTDIKLRVVEIPADVRWQITHTSSGKEWISEEHRTWR